MGQRSDQKSKSCPPLRPRIEDCIEQMPRSVYEFIQRRSDWKKIEKVVDKASRGLRSSCLAADIS